DDLVDPTAEIARNNAEPSADNPGENHRSKADYHRHPGAKDQPRQHVTPELVGAQDVLGAAAGLPERRTEARREAADLWIMGRQHIGKDRDKGDTGEDQGRDQRKVAQPEGYPTPSQARRKDD